MDTKYCMSCMKPMEAGAPRCPYCGTIQSQLSQPVFALPLGYVLHGKYLVGKVLGQGGFGISYIGLDQSLDLRVAIKEYYPMGMVTRGQTASSMLLWNSSVSDKQSGCESFVREARKMAKMDEIPNIVRVRETFFENDTAYIVMDYVEGETLKDRVMREGLMDFENCVRTLMPIMAALEKAHEQGMIHRDISPDNIMIRKDGSVRLLDLGAAKDLGKVHAGHPDVSKTSRVVKQGFSPLEQYSENGNIGSWTDIYALCATIYYVVEGKLLPAAPDRVYHEEIPFPETVHAVLPDPAKRVLEKGLCLNYVQRYQSVGELRQDLIAALSAAPALPPTQPGGVYAAGTPPFQGQSQFPGQTPGQFPGQIQGQPQQAAMPQGSGNYNSAPYNAGAGGYPYPTPAGNAMQQGAGAAPSPFDQMAVPAGGMPAQEQAYGGGAYPQKKKRPAFVPLPVLIIGLFLFFFIILYAALGGSDHDGGTEGTTASPKDAAGASPSSENPSSAEAGWGGNGVLLKDYTDLETLDQETLKQRAEAGEADAQYVLGMLYLLGDDNGENIDEETGVEWIRKSALQGSADAQAWLGHMYQTGLGVSVNYTEAVRWYQKAVDQGSPLAQTGLGYMYEHGLGVSSDYEEALALYQAAAESGSTVSMCNIGYMYFSGEGVEQDYAEALAWFETAAALGDGTGQFNAGYMYENGYGTDKDQEKAEAYYIQSAAQGDEDAIEALDRLGISLDDT